MSEPIALPSPEPPNEAPAEPPPTRQAVRRIFPLVIAAGFLVLAFAIFWLWPTPAPLPSTAEQSVVGRVNALASQVGYLEARVTRLEQRPQADGPDLAPLTARLSALEQRPVAPAPAGTAQPAASAAAPDLAPLSARVAALEQKQQPSMAPVEARIAALESHQPVDSQLATRIDALERSQRAAQSDTGKRLEADEARLAAIEKSGSQTSAIAEQMARVAQVQAAMLALDAGQKLGDIPGAPAALARFAKANPPTEAALRLAFPEAARGALAAARPATEGRPLMARLWAQAQDLVTIRQGDRVLLGDPTAGVLEHARAALDAGDLAGAVASVASLTGTAAQAMAGWLADARALLDARAALAAWAAHA
jgi:hypothetical protein